MSENEISEAELLEFSLREAVQDSVITELVDMVKTSLYREYENMIRGALDVHGQGHQRTSSTPQAKASISINWSVEKNPNIETNLSHNVRVRCKSNRTLELDDSQVQMHVEGGADDPRLVVNRDESPDPFGDEEEEGDDAA